MGINILKDKQIGNYLSFVKIHFKMRILSCPLLCIIAQELATFNCQFYGAYIQQVH